MKFLYALLFLIIFSFNLQAQNYIRQYPITGAVEISNSMSRLICSVYDSVLQDTITYNTPWRPGQIIISDNAYGKIGFTTWQNMMNQNDIVGFISYDHLLHLFTYDDQVIVLDTDEQANVICGPNWINVFKRYDNEATENNFYRYHPYLHKWFKSEMFNDYAINAWTWPPIGNLDVLFLWHDDLTFLYDPIQDSAHILARTQSGVNDHREDHVVNNTNWNDYNDFRTYDPQLHQWILYPRINLEGKVVNGIFWANDIDSTKQKFLFLYDHAIQQWVTDSINSGVISNPVINDRVVTYKDSISPLNKRIVSLVYNPISHQWIKDVSIASGTVSGLTIQNGTVKWTDSNGLNVRGYNNSTGWGNYNTTAALHFYLTDFSSQGYPMIHVRNYSVGTDSIYFDFGDGVISLDNRQAMWHGYETSGTYTVCIFDSAGVQGNCQSTTINMCANAGSISFTNDSICEGDSLTLSLPASNGNIQWQSGNGVIWINETGPGANSPAYNVAPTQTIIYRAVVTSPGCLNAYSNAKQIYVHKNFISVSLSDTVLSRCINTWAEVKVLGISPGHTFQWQYDIGNGWINTSTLSTYSIAHTVNGLYRVILTSGGCFTDTSAIINSTVIAIPPTPLTVGDTACGPGVVNLQANGIGTMLWRQSSQDSILHIGNTFSPIVTGYSTFYVTASDGDLDSIGYVNNAIGTTGTVVNETKGLRLYAASPALIEYLYVYPQQAGLVKINLFHANSRKLIKSLNRQVTPTPGGVKIWFRAYMNGNTFYDLVVDSTSVPVTINTSGFNYPIVSGVSAITIAGYVDTTFHSTSDYYNFYNINVTNGCRSAQAALSVPYYQPLNATIQNQGPLVFCVGDSVILTAGPSSGVIYQWRKNNIPVGTGINYTATTAGDYHVIVSNSVCSDPSPILQVSTPCIAQGTSERTSQSNAALQEAMVTYQHFGEKVILYLNDTSKKMYTILISDQNGNELRKEQDYFFKHTNQIEWDVQDLAPGVYYMTIQSKDITINREFIKN